MSLAVNKTSPGFSRVAAGGGGGLAVVAATYLWFKNRGSQLFDRFSWNWVTIPLLLAGAGGLTYGIAGGGDGKIKADGTKPIESRPPTKAEVDLQTAKDDLRQDSIKSFDGEQNAKTNRQLRTDAVELFNNNNVHNDVLVEIAKDPQYKKPIRQAARDVLYARGKITRRDYWFSRDKLGFQRLQPQDIEILKEEYNELTDTHSPAQIQKIFETKFDSMTDNLLDAHARTKELPKPVRDAAKAVREARIGPTPSMMPGVY